MEENDKPTISSKGALGSKLVLIISAASVSFLVLYFASNSYFDQFLGLPSSLYPLHSTIFVPPKDRPVGDKHYELRKALKGVARDDNTVILTVLNEAWAEPNSIFDVFLESFRIGNNTSGLLNHLLVIAVDHKAYLRCQSLALHCYFLKSSHSSELAHEAKFFSPMFVEMMWERLALLKTVLILGYNFVFTDTDILWFRDPFPYFYPDDDFQISSDYFKGKPFDLFNPPNTGFKFVRSNNRTIKFYKFWRTSRWKQPGLNEQFALYSILRYSTFIKKSGLRIRFLDTDYFGGFCTPSKDLNKVCTMHANCCLGTDKKTADLNTILEDWKRYVNGSLPTNQTTSFRWGAPDKCL